MNTPDDRRRLAILVHLSLQKRFMGNIQDLRQALDSMGYACSLLALRADGDWLDETGLIQFDRKNDVLKLREAGLDVAMGNRKVSGVSTPLPEA